ncbi:hypothetical protein CEY04_02560 [Achromobacter sp. HZ28]|nr:hypothetical protein CEY05_02560 [Achromobacter sp. HZ34]OWT82583.1 hypothetical protein CEY04_02560 [Achromobacter sp. HZ28]
MALGAATIFLGDCVAVAATASADATRHHVLVQTAPGVRIDVIEEGAGTPLVLLPSRGRGAEDFDDVAQRLAAQGYRVIRPQPRGIGQSTGPMRDITLHDLGNDVAAVIRDQAGQPVVIVGHAFGNWVARMTSVDHPELVRGVVIVAAAAKAYPPGLSEHVDRSSDLSLSDTERLKSLQFAFFAPGHDASVWLKGWYPAVNESQRLAGKATKQSDWWSGGKAPMLDLQAGKDPFKPEATRNEVKDEFGDRVTLVVIPGAGHALVPEEPAAVVDALVTWEKSLAPARATPVSQGGQGSQGSQAAAGSQSTQSRQAAAGSQSTQSSLERSPMSSFASSKPLLWQGAAGRKAARFVPIEVSSVKPEKGGTFGIGQSASMEGAYPDARRVEGRVLDATIAVATAIAPAAALPKGLAQGQRAVLGLVDDAHVICVLVPPADVPIDGLAQWAAEQKCG